MSTQLAPSGKITVSHIFFAFAFLPSGLMLIISFFTITDVSTDRRVLLNEALIIY